MHHVTRETINTQLLISRTDQVMTRPMLDLERLLLDHMNTVIVNVWKKPLDV